jgi:hypothetical protein
VETSRTAWTVAHIGRLSLIDINDMSDIRCRRTTTVARLIPKASGSSLRAVAPLAGKAKKANSNAMARSYPQLAEKYRLDK